MTSRGDHEAKKRTRGWWQGSSLGWKREKRALQPKRKWEKQKLGRAKQHLNAVASNLHPISRIPPTGRRSIPKGDGSMPRGAKTPRGSDICRFLPHLCQLKLHEGESPVLFWREGSEGSGAAGTHGGLQRRAGVPKTRSPGMLQPPRGCCSPPGTHRSRSPAGSGCR